MDQKRMTIKRMSQHIGVSTNTLHKAISSGVLPAELITDGPTPYYVINQEDGEHWHKTVYRQRIGRPRKTD
jgi:hypothetical protein